MSTLRRVTSRLGLALAAGLLAVVSAEIALRVWFALRPRPALADHLAGLGPLPRGGGGRWLQALQVVPNERICYRLAAGIDGSFDMGAGKSVRFQTNSYGFRGSDWTRAKPVGTRRIVGLGDSVMMGWGVEIEEAYLSRLAESLNRDGATVRYEPINLGVGGYNTVQEVETLAEVGLAFEPDLVLLGVVANDTSDIIYRGSPPSPLTLERCFLRDALVLPEGAGWPPLHQGWDELREALDRLAEMQRAHGFEVLVITDSSTDTTRTILEVARRMGFETLDLGAALRQRIRDRGLTPKDLELPSDPHPSALAHQLIAEELVDAARQRLR